MQCKKCGEYCGIVPITAIELNTIREYIKKNNIKPVENNFVKYNNNCKFLDNNNKCLIYEVRPFICQHYICNVEFGELPEIKDRNKYLYLLSEV